MKMSAKCLSAKNLFPDQAGSNEGGLGEVQPSFCKVSFIFDEGQVGNTWNFLIIGFVNVSKVGSLFLGE